MIFYLVYKMESTQEYTIYLSSQNSLEKHPKNNCSEFTNNLVPPLKFDNSKWSVCLKSLLMPYLIDNDSHRKNPINFSMSMEIWTLDELNGGTTSHTIKKNLKRITILSPEILDKSSLEIFTIFFEKLHEEINKDIKMRSTQLKLFFRVNEEGFLIINQLIRTKLKTNGIFKNIFKILLYVDGYTQNLLGLKHSGYILFGINTSLNEESKHEFIGFKKISFDITTPSVIYIYSDIIKPIRFGNQQIQILDSLSVGGDTSIIERKNNHLTYHELLTGEINDISIKITDSTHELLINHANETVLCLHFKKK